MALQEQCVAAIAKGIDGYYRLFCTTEDLHLRRGFHLLQKVYCHELVSEIQDGGKLPGHYADLVFNEYLRSLNTNAFAGCSAEKIKDIFVKIGPNLEKIIFDEEFGQTRQSVKVIRHLSSVKSVTFRIHCNNAILRIIAAYCPRLETLDIIASRSVTDAGLQDFCLVRNGKKRDGEGKCLTQKVPCPLLKEIYLVDTFVAHRGIQQLLENLPSVDNIVHKDVPYALYMIHKGDLGHAERMKRYNLKSLDLRYDHEYRAIFYDDILKICATSCSVVKSIKWCISNQEHLTLCSMLTNVEDVALIHHSRVSLDGSGILKERGTQLSSLFLQGFTVSLSLLGQCCPHLKKLRLRSVTIQDGVNVSIPVFHELKQFVIFDIDLSVSRNFSGICHIFKSSPLLEDLRFNGYSRKLIPSEMKKEILKCCELRALKSIAFRSCFLESPEFEFLHAVLDTCSTLKSLDLLFSLSYDTSAFIDALQEIADSKSNKPLISTRMTEKEKRLWEFEFLY